MGRGYGSGHRGARPAAATGRNIGPWSSDGRPAGPTESEAAVVESRPQDPRLILDQVEAELADVEHALRGLDDGTYGVCEACGQAIGPERLASAPAARLCGEHAAAPATPQLW